MSGYTRDLLAFEDSSGARFQYPVCEGLMMVLSGRIAAGPFFTCSRFLSKCRSWVRVKCLEAPVSAFMIGIEIELCKSGRLFIEATENSLFDVHI